MSLSPFPIKTRPVEGLMPVKSLSVKGSLMVKVANLWPAGHEFKSVPLKTCGRCSLVVNVSDRIWLVTSSSPVPLKTHRVGQRCALHLSRAHTSSCWCGVIVRREGASSGVVLVT
ncbi:hypothetical protein TNCV_476471 [Trichonephila clavipes]|nr:hypothetical protein TNCV_476471 [Trichonephila clavipes]